MVLICSFCFSAYKIYSVKQEILDSEQIKHDLIELIEIPEETIETEDFNIDFSSLQNINSDVIGWILVEGTQINYPIVQGENNYYYLNHSFDKSKNSAGWIFADYKNKFDNTDKNIVIYGHNMRDGSMFGSMLNILDAKWYENEENTNITLYTENEKCIYKVFSIYKIENEDYYIKTEFKNDNEFEEFVKNLKKRSIKDFNVDISKDDNILTLSTCANNNKYRIVLHSVRVK